MRALIIATVAVLAACGQQQTTTPATTATVTETTVAASSRPAPSSAADRAGTLCLEGEAVVFSCALHSKVASVCVGASAVTYRYGPDGAPELQIASTGADGVAHVSDIGGGGGGSQAAVRFSQNGYDYIVHSMEAGANTDVPGQKFAGLTVLHGDATVLNEDCPDPAQHQFSTSDIPAPAETDAKYEAWW
ncbi:MAG: hypothetical protein ABUS48_06150 [Pseudomonadota bacterium]